MSRPIPVILDTDIGGDIDDTWALAMLLNSPELDLKLVVTATGDTRYRAKIICKLQALAGRGDIPVAIGLPTPEDPLRKRQAAWVEDYNLADYPGQLHTDGVRALVHAIMEAPEPVTLIAIGPLTNIHAALQLEPRIANRTRFVGMHGSIHRQHRGQDGAIAEFNVVENIPAAQAVFAAPWREIVITPLDTCGCIRLQDDRYQTVKKSPAPLPAAVLENYRLWAHGGKEFQTQSSILFDTVAVYLAFSETDLVMQTHPIAVDDQGFTRIDPRGRPMRVAIDWSNLDAYHTFLVDRLLARR